MSTHLKQKDFMIELGPLGLTMRLKRIVDQMVADARLLYRELGLDIEPNWHAIFLLLGEVSDAGVADVARLLGIKHPSASVLVDQLEARGFVRRKDDPADGRRQILQLTAAAKKKLPELRKVWQAASTAIQSIIDDSGQDLLGAIAAYEIALADESFLERTLNRM